MSSTKSRLENYASKSDLHLLEKLPVITILNGRNFSKVSALLDKPYSSELAQCFYAALASLAEEIGGACLGYSFNDEIVICSRNDQSLETVPWCNNNIQKIASIAASIATLSFNNYAASLDLNLMGEPVFYASSFIVPNLTEAINVFVGKQQQAFSMAVQSACFYELLKKYDRNDIKEMLAGATVDEKINLLLQECSIDFLKYPAAFRRGAVCYRSPKMVIFEGKETIKQKWALNTDLPIFTKEHSFLGSIFKGGSDIVRMTNSFE